MTHAFLADLAGRIETLKADGLFKQEQVISSPQQGEVTLQTGTACINLCANNYLGLSNHPRLVEAARAALSRYGFGMSSVRFICGTQVPHKLLEERSERVSGNGGHNHVPQLFRRQRRAVREPSGSGRLDHIGCVEPRVDYRRCASLPREAVPLRQTTT